MTFGRTPAVSEYEQVVGAVADVFLDGVLERPLVADVREGDRHVEPADLHRVGGVDVGDHVVKGAPLALQLPGRGAEHPVHLIHE
jgi:hypothetical protein